MTVYYFDLTDTIDHLRAGGGITGIQRVVLSLMDAMRDRLGSEVVRALVFRPGRASAEAFDPAALGSAGRGSAAALAAAFGGSTSGSQSLTEYLNSRYGGKPERWRMHELRFRIGHALGFKSLAKRRITLAPRRDPLDAAEPRPVTWSPDDVVLALGAFWAGHATCNERREIGLCEARARGARVAFMVYDLIPHLFPEFVPRPHCRLFAEGLERTVAEADILLAISEATASDLKGFMARMKCPPVPVRVVRLTQSFPAPRQRVVNVRDEVTREIAWEATLPFVLTVSSIDPRKNFAALARVWRCLADEIGPAMPRLLIVGRPSWQAAEFLDMLRATGGHGGLVKVIGNATDTDLEYLYRRCLLTVFPSLYEGWGLPIGESLWFGKLCVASNTSSMPEVGGDLADYFNPYDLEAMMRAIRRPIIDPAYRIAREEMIAQADLRDWAAAGEDLIAAVADGRQPPALRAAPGFSDLVSGRYREASDKEVAFSRSDVRVGK